MVVTPYQHKFYLQMKLRKKLHGIVCWADQQGTMFQETSPEFKICVTRSNSPTQNQERHQDRIAPNSDPLETPTNETPERCKNGQGRIT